MGAKLDSYVALKENHDQQDDHDPYEAFETLSFSDLLTNDDSYHYDEYHTSSFDRDQDNFFEFFSQDFTSSSYTSDQKNEEAPTNVAQEKKTTKKWRRIFRWRRLRRSKPKVVTKNSKSSVVLNGRSSSTISFPMSRGYKRCDPSLWKVSVIDRSRSKWPLFVIGVTKFPTEMELRDMKIRQSRRNPTATMFRAKCEDGNETMEKGSKELRCNSSNSSKSRAKGLWGLLRVLGCSSQHGKGLAF